MTQRELASRLGVSEVTVSRWMTDGAGGRNPSVPTLHRIADALGTTPEYLLESSNSSAQGRTAQDSTPQGDTVNWGAILAGTVLTATAVIGIVALAKAMGKLSENDEKQIKNILDRE